MKIVDPFNRGRNISLYFDGVEAVEFLVVGFDDFAGAICAGTYYYLSFVVPVEFPDTIIMEFAFSLWTFVMKKVLCLPFSYYSLCSSCH